MLFTVQGPRHEWCLGHGAAACNISLTSHSGQFPEHVWLASSAATVHRQARCRHLASLHQGCPGAPAWTQGTIDYCCSFRGHASVPGPGQDHPSRSQVLRVPRSVSRGLAAPSVLGMCARTGLMTIAQCMSVTHQVWEAATASLSLCFRKHEMVSTSLSMQLCAWTSARRANQTMLSRQSTTPKCTGSTAVGELNV